MATTSINLLPRWIVEGVDAPAATKDATVAAAQSPAQVHGPPLVDGSASPHREAGSGYRKRARRASCGAPSVANGSRAGTTAAGASPSTATIGRPLAGTLAAGQPLSHSSDVLEAREPATGNVAEAVAKKPNAGTSGSFEVVSSTDQGLVLRFHAFTGCIRVLERALDPVDFPAQAFRANHIEMLDTEEPLAPGTHTQEGVHTVSDSIMDAPADAPLQSTPDWLRADAPVSKVPSLSNTPEDEPEAPTRSPVRSADAPAAPDTPVASAVSRRTRTAASQLASPPVRASSRSVDISELILPAGDDVDGRGVCRAVVGFQWQKWMSAPSGSGRWGHCAQPLPAGDVLVFGGEGEDGLATDCYRVQPSGVRTSVSIDGLPARKWAACTTIGQNIIVHGGEGAGVHDAAMDLTVVDTSLLLAYHPVVTGKVPPCRSGHSLTLISNTETGSQAAVLFGGVRGRAWSNDVHILDVRTFRWQSVKTSARGPAPRSYHCAVALGTRLVVFGGNNGDRCFNDVYVLDCSQAFGLSRPDGSSSNMPSEIAETASTWLWSKPDVVGSGPCPRTGAVAHVVADRFIVVAGGWDPDAPVTTTPSPARKRGASAGASAGRKRPSASVEADTNSSVFADAYVLDTASWEWFRIADDFVGPCSRSNIARSGAQIVAVDQPSSATPSAPPTYGLAMVGGLVQDGSKCDDAVMLHLPSQFYP